MSLQRYAIFSYRGNNLQDNHINRLMRAKNGFLNT